MKADLKIPRVLVIDDNPAIHDDFRKILCSNSAEQAFADAAIAFLGDDFDDPEEPCFNVELDSALQGEEGYRMAREAWDRNQPYSMAFCDMRMPPGWDGLTTIEKLWEIDPNLEIVICSAYSDNTWADIRNRLGHSDRLLILKKPFDTAEVLQMAAALTKKRELAEQAVRRNEELETLVAARTQHIREARDEAERLLAAISSLLVGLDEAGTINRWNESAANLFGISTASAVGKRFDELPIEWEDRDALRVLLRPDIQQIDLTQRVEIALQDSRGTKRIVGLSTYQVLDGHTNRGLLILGTDITGQRVLEQQLQQAQKLEAVGQLAAGVAHEINTPMQYVGDNLDFLQTKTTRLDSIVNKLDKVLQIAERCGDLSDDENDFISDLQRRLRKLKVKSFMGQLSEAITDSRDGIQHVTRIVRAMKDFAHPGQEEKTPVDINRALESTIAVSTNEWKYVAEITKEFDPTISLVPALAGELNQVFLNVLVNAAHAISDTNDGGNNGNKGVITVSTRSAKDCVEVAISDTGTGMPDEVRQRIFDPFFTTKDVGKGTGQGLAIAHNVVVKKHGGTLECESTPGVGTKFVIRLPVDSEFESPDSELQPLAIGQ